MDATRLAGITHVEIAGRGPRDGFIFDPHRLALPCWALAGPGSLLLTLDRHFDLVAPAVKPAPGLSVLELDELARRELDERNVDHVFAAMEAGLVTDAIAVARAWPTGALHGERYVDARGGSHRIVTARTVDALTGELGASPESAATKALIAGAERILLDVDLDCFTTPGDADPTSVIPWTEELIRGFLMPRGSEAFWEAVLAKCTVLTFAREPAHCGGVVAAGRLFEAASRVIFAALLGADLP